MQYKCHPERSRAKSEAIGSMESKDPFYSFFFFTAAFFFGADFFA